MRCYCKENFMYNLYAQVIHLLCTFVAIPVQRTQLFSYAALSLTSIISLEPQLQQ